MKCDELGSVEIGGYWVFDKDEVDAAIAELKDFAENACLERDDNQNAIDELQAENRKLKRALWMARAERARDNSILLPSKFMRNVWDNVERKCLKKAEEYK